MSQKRFNKELLEFLERSPTAFHAVAALKSMLLDSDFIALSEEKHWQLVDGQGYFVTRNDSAIIAFRHNAKSMLGDGLRLTGAHTDSPSLKVKPSPEVQRQSYVQLGIEVYGGALFAPWFDRDLSLAGRVNYKSRGGELRSALIDFSEPIAVIPSLAIHLDRRVNDSRSINPQKELMPVLSLCKAGEKFDFNELLLQQVKKQRAHRSAQEILAHELYFYDTQAPSLVGLKKEFIASARLDNLLSCFLACKALISCKNHHASLLVCNDHEEVGSTSSSGAQGPFLKSVLVRLSHLCGDEPDLLSRIVAKSSLISIDNAHGVHPNYLEKHDDRHRPILNAGPVIKLNANQRYASNSHSVALFKSICDAVKVPHQSFVMRNDMACGSTIGPITSAETGINTIDVGVPTFVMHSIRELAGVKDAFNLSKIITSFYSR
ncbi:MAG: M18 family aminopeptidase [Gammaproteobacteria bacterium]|nr:M18 family aminopeptidase [Gammaproteobacteria bacterium]